MPKYLTLDEAYHKCKKEGKYLLLNEVDIAVIKSMILIAEGCAKSAERTRKELKQDSIEWNSVYILYYNALHTLAEAMLRIDKLKIENHQCLFAFLCEKHPELEFSWDTLEKIRTKRNGIHYYGKPIQFDDWKETEIQITSYIKKIKEEIQKNIP
jgi:hypothetical protein